MTTQWDIDGSGNVDLTRTDVTVVNLNGSHTQAVSDLNVPTDRCADEWVMTTSATGLSQTTQWDRNGDGTVDTTRTSVTASTMTAAAPRR